MSDHPMVYRTTDLIDRTEARVHERDQDYVATLFDLDTGHPVGAKVFPWGSKGLGSQAEALDRAVARAREWTSPRPAKPLPQEAVSMKTALDTLEALHDVCHDVLEGYSDPHTLQGPLAEANALINLADDLNLRGAS